MRQVLDGSEPILLVSHDANDHGWQFIGISDASVTDGRVVCLEHIVQLDPTVCDVADLAPGWQAVREEVGGPWSRRIRPPDSCGFKASLIKFKHRSVTAIGVAVAVAIFAFCGFTQAPSNLWSLLTGRGFFIPTQSSIFSFRTTVDNPGSGEWWLYGEDSRYFYALHDHDPRYLAFPKAKQRETRGFQPADYKTWPPESTISSPVP